MTFARYALYFAPPADAAWAQWAAAWLGWDMETGQPLAHPACDLDVAAITETPRKYGLHATLKPPMRLAEGQTEAALRDACATLATSQKPLRLEGLEIAKLGRFLALRPTGDETALNQLAAACVETLDAFRAPPTEAELTRRRGNGLSPAQEANLTQWGYPHVMELFRFHITLSGKLDKPTVTATEAYLTQTLLPLLPQPFEITDLALVGERADGRFELIQRYPLASG
ncbi:putative phosphonate metabolism protein [Tritonibacter multivorans]|uniref:Putative phosphonate metabolism protein n=1 Tax=Tritonibacter multivorans TaxID=928856 RepID=A0A0N7LYU6_9RHOB|nr:DUF1045 domain-containing protein [Tritonibacter multivorans]MDA7419625.1 DUF1045 domain-containing protein [Tritonibacter multivorans]CUH75849.1 putative phosphonate metabolism protein [Tritonibacter multivorans]SFC59958.1 putative phosphonate metabolism protein [Tritonibacter multivorans]